MSGATTFTAKQSKLLSDVGTKVFELEDPLANPDEAEPNESETSAPSPPDELPPPPPFNDGPPPVCLQPTRIAMNNNDRATSQPLSLNTNPKPLYSTILLKYLGLLKSWVHANRQNLQVVIIQREN